MICVKCGAEMDQTEKDTSSGRDIREYMCRTCGHSDWEVRGPALWQILHDDRLEAEAERVRLAAEKSAAETIQGQSGSVWQRWVTRLGAGFRRRQ